MFLKLIFIGVELLYNVVFISTVQHSDLAVCIHVPPLFGFECWFLVSFSLHPCYKGACC